MSSCLIDYILIEGVPARVMPNSGYYLNRELTIPLKNITSAINAEQNDLTGIWDDVQVKALRKFVIRLQLGMQEMFSNCLVVDEDWICDNKDALAIPWMYFLGAELLLELKHTDRINRFTTIDRGRADEMRNEYLSEFQIQLKAALEIINAEGDAGPIGDVFHYVEVLP